MANLNHVLNEHIRRLARREITGHIKAIRKTMAQYRRDIVALKRQVDQLQKTINRLDQQCPPRPADTSAAPPKVEGIRFRADGLKSHRTKLGLSAKEYGRLVGVSGLTIYNWENGKTRPRSQQLANLATVRGIGKREAMKRLGTTDATKN